MNLHEKLLSLYDSLFSENEDTAAGIDLFVVPLIRFNYKKSDYLYLLYKEILENDESRYRVHSTSISEHWKFVWNAFRGKPTILHYHWLECSDFKSLLGIVYKLFCIKLFKRFGGKIVWTIHNKMPHDRRFKNINESIRSSMAQRADLLHVHCNTAKRELCKFFDQPESKFSVIPHPEYPAEKLPRKKAIHKLNRKRDLQLSADDQIFLMFGNISSYKQIDKVAKLFEQLPENKKLIIVGPVKKGQMVYYHKIKKISSNSSNIRLIPHFIPEADVPLYHSAADCVLFNFRDILTSGGVALAQSYDVPIIAPSKGCLSELNGDNVYLFENEDELNSRIINFASGVTSDG
ncbi:glycosyltransferase [Rhodohalobacter sp. SW132]|uniref:glycosyltransferase n=1 Tax=Rhodohalobacter sp. SW132 TaxID=2293433 RepID=UPI000E2645C5|nr:glycosyltransferase [Rhodohalobacter sp. SW132]REL38269.1 glycosyltransferase [Rhodohalobacter sp. SW132]